MQNTYWEKDQINEFIRILRPVLVLLICAVHIPYIAGYTNEATPLDAPQMLLSVYIKDVISRSGVPLLSIVSGYLAFYSYKKYGYKNFLYKKTTSLLIPFIVVNIITLAIFLAAQHITNTTIHSTQNVDDFLSMVRAVFGINRLPVNGPLYFLRDLFLICCGIAIIDIVARSRIATAAVILYLIYLNSSYPSLIIRFGDTPVSVLYRLDMIIFFLLGYFLSIRNIKPLKTESYTAFTAMLFYLFLMLLVAITISAIKPESIEYFKGRWAIGLVAFFFIPAFMAISYKLRDTKAYKFLLKLSPYSFMIFLTHAVFSYFYLKATQHMLPGISLTSPLYIQIIYFTIYLTGCSLFAIAIRKVLMSVRSRLPHKTT